MSGQEKSQANDVAGSWWAWVAWQPLTSILLKLIYPINCCSRPFHMPTWGQLEMCGGEPLPLINCSLGTWRGREKHCDKLYCPTLLQQRCVSYYIGCQSISYWFYPGDVIALVALPGLGWWIQGDWKVSGQLSRLKWAQATISMLNRRSQWPEITLTLVALSSPNEGGCSGSHLCPWLLLL